MEQKLLHTYLAGNASAHEKKKIVEWLNAKEENMQEFLALRNLYDITLWHEEELTVLSPAPLLSSKKSKIYRQVLELSKIAAIILITFSCMKYFYFSDLKETTTMQTVYVPSGQRSKITLADGTEVWLNAKTTFTFPNHFSNNSREVLLDGEGYFDVVHNEKKPFIVKTQYYDIHVLGTKFNVSAYSHTSSFETSLLSGLIEVISCTGNERIRLYPHQKVFLKNNRLNHSNIGNYDYFLWKDGIISFEDETVREILDKLQLYYDIQIIIKNKSILSDRYTGKFRTKDGIEHIMKVLQLNKRFTYEKVEETNTLIIR
ncbi:FecR family protein [Parabacteroides pacaensis]|uniref:FecR family protein n=1 Tax=Parabacteroides pacaensis TaxID=2086575 RepID=UPI000D0ECF42|nr:FecR family protein [Parabacteroides pacaensis]